MHHRQAGTVATEVITLLRTVMTFGTKEREIERYTGLVSQTERDGKVFAIKCVMAGDGG
jgi:hypothetical protein